VTAERASGPGRETGRTRAVVAEFLRRHPGSTPKAIALGAGLSRDLAKRTALRMAADGELTVVGRGHYFWIPPHRRYLAPVPGIAPDVPGDIPPEETTAPAVPESWRCAQCGWRQAMASVETCELCGWPRAREVPR
jgi:hypothetical protein